LPTYEYACDHCKKNFDVVQSFHDDPLTSCPTCGSPVRKVFGNVGIVFKGSGFYKTDSRNGGSGKKEAAETSTPATSGSEGSGSSGGGGEPSKSGDSGTQKPSDSGSKESKPSESSPSKSADKKSDSGTPASAAKSSS
jgi:putative FmdB family regulatory protein